MRLEPRLRNFLTILALCVGAVLLSWRYAEFVDLDLNFSDYVAPREGRFGRYCYGAIGNDAAGFGDEALIARQTTLLPFRIPYSEKSAGKRIPAGGYLYIRCPLDLSPLAGQKFAWMELGPLSGRTTVYLNDSRKLLQADGQRAGFPILPEERTADATITFIARGHADRSSLPGPSFVGFEPFFTSNRVDLERLETYLASNQRFSLLHLGYALTLLIVFGVVWLYGMRYPDVCWMLIVAATLALRASALVAPADARELFEVQTYHVAHTLLSVALPAFVYAFSRRDKGRAIPWSGIALATLVAAACGYFVYFDELRAATRLELALPSVIGALLLGFVTLDGFRVRRFVPALRRRRVLQMASIAGVSAALYANSALVYMSGVWSWTAPFDMYLPYVVTSLFACFLMYDLVVHHRNYYQEKAARARSEAIAQTAQMVAHDVRKPLSLMTMGLDVLREAKTEKELRRAADMLVGEVDKAMTRVNGLLRDVMEIGASDVLTREIVDLGGVIDNALAAVLPLHDGATERVVVVRQVAHTRMVPMDVEKMERVLTNILDNALHAMRARGTMKIVTHDDPAASRVVVRLVNDGPQIPEEVVPKLFDAFFTNGKKGGTGLGLAIAKKVVEAHGGEIAAASAAKETVFEIKLPAAQAAAVSEAVPVLAPAPVAARPEIVFVEDNVFIREAWTSALERDVTLHTFASPTEARARLATDPEWARRLTAVITDQHFDDDDETGVEFARTLRAAKHAWPIFLCTDSHETAAPREIFTGRLDKVPQPWQVLRDRLDQ